jgi:hypothetical protein
MKGTPRRSRTGGCVAAPERNRADSSLPRPGVGATPNRRSVQESVRANRNGGHSGTDFKRRLCQNFGEEYSVVEDDQAIPVVSQRVRKPCHEQFGFGSVCSQTNRGAKFINTDSFPGSDTGQQVKNERLALLHAN